jgi:hypothetical protein
MNVEARRVRKHIGIVVRGQRRRPYHHALEDGRASGVGVARGDAREGEITITGEAKAFLERVGNERRVADQRSAAGHRLPRLRHSRSRSIARDAVAAWCGGQHGGVRASAKPSGDVPAIRLVPEHGLSERQLPGYSCFPPPPKPTRVINGQVFDRLHNLWNTRNGTV